MEGRPGRQDEPVDGTAPISVPLEVAARSLTVAGLAAWVLAQAGRPEQAQRCGLLQEFLDEAFRRGGPTPPFVPRSVVEEAAVLWEAAAGLLDSGASVNPQQPRPQEDQQAAARLRLRADRLRRLLREQSGGSPTVP